MSTIFMSHSKQDAACAESLRQGLAAQGYTLWREPDFPGPSEYSYPHMIEMAIVGSATLVLVWSGSTLQAEEVERQILFAQRLKKLIFPVLLDATALPPTLIVDATLPAQAPCTDAVASLVVLPGFPPAQSTDPLLAVYEKAGHEYLRVRKEAVDQAADLLKQGTYLEELLALLEYLAQHDEMVSVRDKAQEALQAIVQQAAPPPLRFLNPADSRHVIGVRCKACGKVSYFDKRSICSAQSQVVRGTSQRGGKELDEMDLPCEHCKHIMPTSVDCEGYKVRVKK